MNVFSHKEDPNIPKEVLFWNATFTFQRNFSSGILLFIIYALSRLVVNIFVLSKYTSPSCKVITCRTVLVGYVTLKLMNKGFESSCQHKY